MDTSQQNKNKMNNNVKVARKLVTPELATKYLSSNQGNRKLSERQINFYYKQMISGDWGTTGDTIKISSEGRLLDGQHRLHAVVRYDKPVEMFIAEGIDPALFPMIDTGKPRTASDVLSSNGVGRPTNMASAAKYIMLYDNSQLNRKHNKDVAPSHKRILQFISENPDLEGVVETVIGVHKKFKAIPVALLATLYWITSRKNYAKAHEFLTQYGSGIGLNDDSPVRLLRERLIKDSLQRKKLSQRDRAALYIMCWNLFITGKTQSHLTLSKNYSFPKPI